jgi:replicative DNA helicase
MNPISRRLFVQSGIALVGTAALPISARGSLARANPSPVPTGFTELDDLTGGLHPGNLIAIGGRPGMGKTSLALAVAANAAIHHRIPVLVFSLEAPKAELMERMLCSEARVDIGRLRRGRLNSNDKVRIIHARRRIAAAPLFVDDAAAPTIDEIRAKALRFRSNSRGLVIVDYLQLIGAPGRKWQSRGREIAEMTRGLKALATELQMPVIVTSQLARRRHLRKGGAIRRDADLVMFIHRDVWFDADLSLRETTRLVVAKNRNGATKEIPLKFTREHSRFESAG